MANTIASKVELFTKNLDTIAQREALTTDLNMNQSYVGEFSGAGTVKVAKLAMDGLGDYARETGFTNGSVILDWEDLKLSHDRAQGFQVDSQDDDETAAILSANLMSEFERTKVIPEIDATRFAAYAAGGTTVSGAIADAAAAAKALRTAETAIEEAEADPKSCILYVNPTFKQMLREAQPYSFADATNPDTTFDTYDGMKIVTVPSARFYTAITLGTNGYSKDSKASVIDFMLVDPDAVIQVAKLEKLRYFAPDVNQAADAHKWQYRLYHDAFVKANSKTSIQLHVTATA